MTTLKSLERQKNVIALEAFLSLDVQGLLKNTLPELVAGLKDYVFRFAPNTPGVQLTPRQHEFITEVSKHSYMDITPLAASIPQGLNVTYLEYSGPLLEAAKHAAAILSGAMTSYSTFLAQLVTNTDAKFNTISLDRLHKELADKRVKAQADVAACFKAGSTKSESTYGEVIDRNVDWKKVFQSANDATKVMNTVDRVALNKKIRECTDLLDIVITKMEKNEFEGMSPEAIINLSSGAYEMAKELEFFSFVYYQTIAYAEAINSTVNRFMQINENWK
jgi:hypothetical protein